MYIIIVGGGRLGYYLLKALLSEGHEAFLVEKDAVICQNITEELGSVCYRGDGCEVTTLTEIGTGRADMFVAVTGGDEDNLVSCQIAKEKFHVPRTIARIRNPQNAILFKKLGIDVTVSSTDVILEHIEEEVPTHSLTHLLNIREKGLEIVEVKIPPDSPTIGLKVRQLALPEESVVALVIRKEGKYRVSTPNTIIESEDRLIVLTPAESEDALRKALRGA